MKTFIKLAFVSYLALVAVFVGAKVYIANFSDKAIERQVREIYSRIIAVTGQAQDALPLEISDSKVENAYNNGSKIVIYKGLIDHASNWDEIALVLGHEVAHGMLWHLKMPLDKMSDTERSVLEGNADKLGAVYMMKAGYDICTGREMMKRWKDNHGNTLGLTHPDFAYRYDELNINCE